MTKARKVIKKGPQKAKSSKPARSVFEPPPEKLSLVDIFQALSDSVRLEIVVTLYHEGECTCARLDGGRPKSTMSHHFRVLRTSGLVQTRLDGVTHRNALRTKELNTQFPGLIDAIVSAAGK